MLLRALCRRKHFAVPPLHTPTVCKRTLRYWDQRWPSIPKFFELNRIHNQWAAYAENEERRRRETRLYGAPITPEMPEPEQIVFDEEFLPDHPQPFLDMSFSDYLRYLTLKDKARREASWWNWRNWVPIWLQEMPSDALMYRDKAREELMEAQCELSDRLSGMPPPQPSPAASDASTAHTTASDAGTALAASDAERTRLANQVAAVRAALIIPENPPVPLDAQGQPVRAVALVSYPVEAVEEMVDRNKPINDLWELSANAIRVLREEVRTPPRVFERNKSKIAAEAHPADIVLLMKFVEYDSMFKKPRIALQLMRTFWLPLTFMAAADRDLPLLERICTPEMYSKFVDLFKSLEKDPWAAKMRLLATRRLHVSFFAPDDIPCLLARFDGKFVAEAPHEKRPVIVRRSYMFILQASPTDPLRWRVAHVGLWRRKNERHFRRPRFKYFSLNYAVEMREEVEDAAKLEEFNEAVLDKIFEGNPEEDARQDWWDRVERKAGLRGGPMPGPPLERTLPSDARPIGAAGNNDASKGASGNQRKNAAR